MSESVVSRAARSASLSSSVRSARSFHVISSAAVSDRGGESSRALGLLGLLVPCPALGLLVPGGIAAVSAAAAAGVPPPIGRCIGVIAGAGCGGGRGGQEGQRGGAGEQRVSRVGGGGARPAATRSSSEEDQDRSDGACKTWTPGPGVTSRRPREQASDHRLPGPQGRSCGQEGSKHTHDDKHDDT